MGFSTGLVTEAGDCAKLQSHSESGLTPAPTCLTGARWYAQCDVAFRGNQAGSSVALLVRALSFPGLADPPAQANRPGGFVPACGPRHPLALPLNRRVK